MALTQSCSITASPDTRHCRSRQPNMTACNGPPIGPVYGRISNVPLSSREHRHKRRTFRRPGNIRTSPLNQRQLSRFMSSAQARVCREI